MTVLQQEGFEGCTVGQAVEEADTIFSNVTNTGVTCVSPGLDGTNKAATIDTTATATVRNSGFTAMGQLVTRFILKFANAPGANTPIVSWNNGDPNIDGTRIAHLYLNTDRKLALRNVWTQEAVSTMALSTGTEYAVEWYFDGANQQQTLRIFTDVDEDVATPAETVGPVDADVGPTTVNWIEVGKMASGTWTGGLTIDRYKRANAWVAQASSESVQWNEEWTGTTGNDITLPTNWALEGAHQDLPNVTAGGPHIDQQFAQFGTQTTGDRRLRSLQLPNEETGTWERFYFNTDVKPLTIDEQEEIWAAGNNATPVVNLFQLIMTGGQNDTINLELRADEGWDQYVEEPDQAPQPLGVILGLAIDTWHRIEIEVDTMTGPATCTVRVWEGGRLHQPGTPDQEVSGACVGTTQTRYRRYGQYLHPDAPAGTSHRRVRFESVKCSKTGWVGPLSEANQYTPPLNANWTFYEWDGSSLTELSLAGASTGGATLEEVTIGEPEPPPPSGGRFTGDPGVGKLYLSADTDDSPRWNVIADLFNFEMRTLSAGSGHPASNRCAAGVYRDFYGYRGGILAKPTFSQHSWTTWDNPRKAAANTAISSQSYDCTATTAATLYNESDPSLVAWVRDQLAPFITDVYERYGHLYCIDLGNEPDQGDKPNEFGPLCRHRVRRAARYLHFKLLDLGVPEEAFMVTCATPFAMTAQQHGNRHAVAINTTDTQWPGSRGDAIYYYNPDWKATRTVSGGYWSDAYDPNPADFIQPGEMDEWGYGRGPVQRMVQWNMYDKDYEYGAYDTLAKFRSFRESTPGGWPHHGNLYVWNKALYGGSDPVLPVSTATPSGGLPVFIGECGFGVWCPEPTSSNDAQPDTTADFYVNTLVKDLTEVCNWIGYAKWRYVGGATYNGTSTSGADTFTHHWKVGAGGQAGTRIYDPTNANTKAEAALFNTTYVADPPPWPDGTPRPPDVWINGGAKRDYRGFNDVP